MIGQVGNRGNTSNYPLDIFEFACGHVVSKLDVCEFDLSTFFFWCNLAGTLPENTNPKQTVPQQVMQARGAPLSNLIAYLMMLHEESRFEG